MKFNRMLGIACAIMALGGLPSCSRLIVTDDDIIGVWIPDNTSKAGQEATTKCHLSFRKNGVVELINMPDSFMKPPGEVSNALVSGSGRWSIERKGDSIRISLVLNEVDGVRVTYQSSALILTSRATHKEIFFYPGEEGGTRFVLTKVGGKDPGEAH